MASVPLLVLIAAAYTCGVSASSCTDKQDGVILEGDTCQFKCCLGGTIYTMKSTSTKADVETNTCPAFPLSGNECLESGIKFPSKSVIKYNDIDCYICNNGKQVLYENANPMSGPDSVTDYTLVRFG